MPRGVPSTKNTKYRHDAKRLQITAPEMLRMLKHFYAEFKGELPVTMKGAKLKDLGSLIKKASPIPQSDMRECRWEKFNHYCRPNDNLIHVTYGDNNHTLCGDDCHPEDRVLFELWANGNPADVARCKKCISLSGDKEWSFEE